MTVVHTITNNSIPIQPTETKNTVIAQTGLSPKNITPDTDREVTNKLATSLLCRLRSDHDNRHNGLLSLSPSPRFQRRHARVHLNQSDMQQP